MALTTLVPLAQASQVGFLPTSTTFTWMGWFQRQADTGLISLFYGDDNGANWEEIDIASGVLRLNLFNGTNTFFPGTTPIQIGVWYHVAYVVNGSSHTLYLSSGDLTIDARVEATATYAVGVTPTDPIIFLSPSLAQSWSKMWRTALNQTQVRQNRNTQGPVTTTNFWAGYPLATSANAALALGIAGAISPNNIAWDSLVETYAPWGANQLFVGGETENHYSILSSADGSNHGSVTMQPSASDGFAPAQGVFADILPASGLMGSWVPGFSSSGNGCRFNITDPTYANVAHLDPLPYPTYITFTNAHNLVVTGDGQSAFFVAAGWDPVLGHPHQNFWVARINSAGTVTSRWQLPYVTCGAMAASVGGGVLYYVEASNLSGLGTPNLSPLHRFNTASGTPMSDLRPGGVMNSTWGAMMRIDPVSGDLFIPYQPNLSIDNWVIQRINVNTGVILQTYNVGASQGFDVLFTFDLTNPTVLWTVTSDPTISFAVFQQFNLAFAFVETTFQVAMNGNQEGAVPTLDGPFFAKSPNPTPPPNPGPAGCPNYLALQPAPANMGCAQTLPVL